MTPVIGDAIEGVISSTIGPLFARLIDLIPDPAEKARQAALIQQQLMVADAAMIQQQNAINLAEASASNLFVSGWRPAVGWVCVAGLAWQIIIAPLMTYAVNMTGYAPILPVLNGDWIMTIMIPLLGLGGLKTIERLNGVSTETTKPTIQQQLVVPSASSMQLPSAPQQVMQASLAPERMDSVYGSQG